MELGSIDFLFTNKYLSCLLVSCCSFVLPSESASEWGYFAVKPVFIISISLQLISYTDSQMGHLFIV